MARAHAASHPRSREKRTRYVLLGILTRGPMNGYALRQAIAGSVGHFWHESFGQIYPALRELSADGLVRPVRARVRRSGSGRGGVAYELTSRGRGVLSEWLAQPPVLEPSRNEVLLKVFFGGAVPAEVTLRNLAAVEERVRAESTKLEEIAASWTERARGHPDAPFWRLTLDFGLAFTRTALGWLDEAQRVVGARARGTARPGNHSVGHRAVRARRAGRRARKGDNG